MASILKPKFLSGNQPTATPAPIESVLAQSKAILEQCQKECESLREQTRQQAVEEGQAIIDQLAKSQAESLVQEKISHVLERVDSVCDALENATQQWLRAWQHETVSLAIKIAEKVISRQIESDPTILITWLEDLVQLVQSQRRLTIKLNSQDALQLADALPELIERFSPSVEFQIVDDPNMERCSVVIDAPETTLDRSIKTQLDRLEQELR